MIIFSMVLSVAIIFISYLISHKTSYPVVLGIANDEGERKSQYECGIEPFEEEIGIETRERFYIKFYIIGIIFLIFDLESLLLYPFTVAVKNITNQFPTSEILYSVEGKSFMVFIIFIIILVLGLIYEYRKKVL